MQSTIGNRATAALFQGGGSPLPDALRAGIESLSGVALEGVSVRLRSPQPARLGVQAFTRATEIDVAPGFEHHLPHEAWHVMQQAQGRVRTSAQPPGGGPISDDAGLEHEADVMGARAVALGGRGEAAAARPAPVAQPQAAASPTVAVQAKGRLNLASEDPGVTPEEHVAVLALDSEEEVLLKRGVTPAQKKYLENEVIRGSYVSFPQIVRGDEEEQPEDVGRPSEEAASEYVKQSQSVPEALVEFSTNPNIASTFGSEARYGYVLTVRIKRKYLTKGATGGESGWVAKQAAPFEIVHVTRSVGPEVQPLTDEQFRLAIADEQTALFLLENDPALQQNSGKTLARENIPRLMQARQAMKKKTDEEMAVLRK